MSSATSARECPICLGKFRNPVVTPCGHLTCELCINAHVRRSEHPYEATCPSCRTSFPKALADLSTIPTKYHAFISPPLRRVYLGEVDDGSRTIIDGLKSEITTLKRHNVTLSRDIESLSKNLLESRNALLHLASSARDARLSLDEANQRLEGLRAEYDTPKCRGMNPSSVTNTNRINGQAALGDTSSNNGRSSSQVTDPSKGRTIGLLATRTSHRSMTSLIYDGPRDVDDRAGYRYCCVALAFVVGLFWYTSARWTNDMNRADYSRRW